MTAPKPPARRPIPTRSSRPAHAGRPARSRPATPRAPRRAGLAAIALLLLAATALPAQPPAGYYDTVDPTNGTTLRLTLHEVVDDHTRFPYTASTTDTWDILNLADEDPNDTGNIIDVYKNASYAKISGGTGAYNREHTWPKSYGFPNDGSTNYPYTDCHMLFLSDSGYNSSRSNKPYRTCHAGCSEQPTDFNDGRGGGSGVYPGNSNWTTGSFTAGTWETWDGRKGDVARAIFYMDVRYEGGTHGGTGAAEPDLVVTDVESLIDASNTGSNESVAYMGMLTVLLQWHQQDPVDSREVWRNEVVYTFQGNRNPFIDHPEWIDCLYNDVCSTDSTPPAPPSGLLATAGNGAVDLSWIANGESDLAGYNVYRSTTAGGPYSKLNGGLVATNAYTDTTVTNGTTYFYVVTAVDTSSNESGDSNEVSATPDAGLPDVTPPAAPTGLAATPGDGQVDLAWNPNGESDLAGYNVHRSTASGGPYTQLNGALLGSASYTDATAVNGTTYYYVVTAVDTSANESADSNEAAATPQAAGPASVVLSEVLYDVSGGDGGFEWFELYNAGAAPVDLSGWCVGNGGTDYTYSTVQLAGTVAGGATFVVGGPSSAASNGNPAYDQVFDFNPDFQNSGSTADGVALFDAPCAQVTGATVPVDAVVYGGSNSNNLIDEAGTANPPEVGDAGPGSSIERLDLAGAWQIQAAPTPNATPLPPPVTNQAPVVTISAPADGSSFAEGASISFTGTASDPEDGDLTAGLAWTSDLDGAIGSGGSFSAVLSVGTHLVTATVTDSGGLQGADATTVTVDAATPSAGDLLLSEVFYDADGADDGLEWVEIYNNDSVAIDLAGFSLGNGGTDYTTSLVQLSGTIQPGATFVVGGPTSSATNHSPVLDLAVDFNPDFQNSGTAGDGVALFNLPATVVTAATVPIDAVVYGPNNNNALIDESGSANGPEVGDAPAGSSIERLDVAGAWQIQGAPTPNATPLNPPANTAPTVTITAPADGSSFAEGTSIAFSGSASDLEDGDLTASLSWTSDLDGPIGSGGSFSATLSVGTHTVNAAVTDSGGLQGSDQIIVTVNANVAPTATITAPANGSSFSEGTSISFTGSASDPEDGDLTSSLAWTSDLDGAIGSGGSFSATLSVGTHTVTAAVTDSGGLQGSDAITVTVNSSGGPVTVTFTATAAEDGWVRESSENSNAGGKSNSGAGGGGALRAGDDRKDRQYKAVVSFDTAAIPDGATILSATLRLRRGTVNGTNPFTTHGTCWVDVHSGGLGGSTALASGDFEAVADVARSAALSNAAANGDWSEASLDPVGLGAVNQTGATQLRIHFDLDDNDDRGNDYVGYYSADDSDPANHPQLEVTYQE